jgi:hypothetical protein
MIRTTEDGIEIGGNVADILVETRALVNGLAHDKNFDSLFAEDKDFFEKDTAEERLTEIINKVLDNLQVSVEPERVEITEEDLTKIEEEVEQ